ncbi:MAG: heme lyase CcmF/NrfE family subunit [Brevundimonas sp.]|uniref:heme lyase CcmF/NrfE family subunit n=1 Tax=Brevundimonas sp. TaxID=1871086 RepID=UPI00391C228C
MIAETGAYLLALALALGLMQTLAAGVGRALRNPVLSGAAEGAAVACALALAGAFAALIWAFVTSDFSVTNVALNSHTDKPLFYRIAGAWGSHEGSLVMWCLVMAAFGAVLAQARNLPFGLKTSAVAVQGALTVMFLCFLVFTSSPFVRLDEVPVQGNSLNPLLQDPALAVHPPLLYVGYVGLSVVFSLACAALIEGRADAAFARWVRPWTLASWSALTLGIMLGSFWAYYELGWGGWWFWDPVENASFLPWLVATALLHSAIVSEKRGALMAWTVFLSLLAFSFSMLGAFLVRSGVLTSVHAFAVDPERGMLLLGILAVAAGAGFALFAWRVPSLRRGGLFAPVSREASLVLNNLFLTVAAATVLLGTLYPLILEAITGETISVGPPYFNLTFTPLMVPAMLLVPLGPLLAWKRADVRGALQRLWMAALISMAVAVIVHASFEPRGVLAALGVGIGVWLVAGAVVEMAERTRLMRVPLAETLRRLRALPRGAFGMTLAHAGLGLFIMGACVEVAYKTESAAVIAPGGTVVAGDWQAQLRDVRVVEGPNYIAEQARVRISRIGGGAVQREITTERRLFPVSGQVTTEVGLDFRGLDDIYVVLGERRATESGEAGWSLRVYHNPWARLIFLGPALMALGGLISVSDRRLRLGWSIRRRRPVKGGPVRGEPAQSGQVQP